MANGLPKRKVKTPRGGTRHPQTVKMVMQLLASWISALGSQTRWGEGTLDGTMQILSTRVPIPQSLGPNRKAKKVPSKPQSHQYLEQI